MPYNLFPTSNIHKLGFYQKTLSKSSAIDEAAITEVERALILFPPQKPENERKDDADYYAGGQGKIEGEIFAADEDVAGKTAQERNSCPKKHNCPNTCNNKAEEDEDFA